MNSEPCICGHLETFHNAYGRVVCAVVGQRCPAYWSKTDYAETVQTALAQIVVANAKSVAKKQARDGREQA